MGRKHLFHFLAQMFVVFLTEFNFLRVFQHRCFPYCTVGFIDATSHASICSPIRQHVTNLQLCHQRVFVYLHINAALQLERLFWEIVAIWTSITSKKINRKGLTNKWVENQKLKDESIAYSFKNFGNEGKIIC